MTVDRAAISTREELMPWIEVAQGMRLSQYAIEALGLPVPGSFPPPDIETDSLHNMTAWCRGYLEAAVDHLAMWAEYAIPLKFHPDTVVAHTLRPTLTLARAAMECAAQAIRILDPEDAAERARRYILLGLADLNEQLKADTTPTARATLQVRRHELFDVLGLPERKFSAPRYLDMLQYVAKFVGNGADDDESSVVD